MVKEEHQKKESKNKKKHLWLYRLLFWIALCVFVYSAFQLFTIFKANWDEKRELERVSELGGITKDPQQPFQVHWEDLKAINEDIVAWIIVPGTNISYPVLLGDDNQYYLTHTFEKANNYAGSIFMDYNNQGDFSNPHTLVYGHNTRHGTMFSELESFADATFFEEHPYVYIFTPDQNYKCDIVTFQSTKDTSSFYQLGFTGEQDWLNYLSMIQSNTIDGYVRQGVSLEASDRIVSLSTCSYEINNEMSDQRYLLQAKLVPWDGDYIPE